MKVYKNKKGYYCRAYNKLLDTTVVIHGDTEAQARKSAIKYMAQSDYKFSQSISFGDAFEDFVNERTTLSPSTLRSYRCMYKSNLCELSEKRLDELDTKTLQKFIDKKAMAYSPKYVHNLYGLVTSVLTFNGVEKPLCKLPQKPRKRLSLPSEDMLASLLDTPDEALKLSIELGLYAGLRCGEIAALQKSDLEGNVLHISKSMVRGSGYEWVVKLPKTEDGYRDVTIPQFLADRIRKGSDKVVPYNSDQISHKFLKHKDRLGIDCSMHRLRHYSASYLSAQGVSDQEILSRFGWSSVDMFRVYMHDLNKDKSAQAIENLAQNLKKT